MPRLDPMLARGRCTLLSLLVGSLPACSAEDPRTGPAASAGSPAVAVAGTDAAGGKIAATCTTGDQVEPATREALGARALEIYAALRRGDDPALWEQVHPQARHDDQREAFVGALGSLRERLESVTGEPTVHQVHRVDLRGGVNTLAKVECGAPDDPERFTLLTNAGGEDVAVVSLHSGPVKARYATVVQLRRRGDRWHLLGLHANPITYRGHAAADYEAMADLHMSQQRVVVAHALFGLARLLSDRGPSIQTATHERVVQKIAAIERDQLFAAETGTWTLGDARFDIQGLSLVATQSDISPVFEYVSPQGLVKDLLDRDADALVAEVGRRFPALAEHFDAVVFEAYAEVPNEPGKSYQAFRVVRYLDPSRRRG